MPHSVLTRPVLCLTFALVSPGAVHAADPGGEENNAGVATEATEAQPQLHLPALIVTGKSSDEIGHDNVYDKNISNYYVDRSYLERYRGVSVGDVFAGMNGVYNSDNRNGAALFPNIRGLSGNGRVPVTVDGTVQSLDVWMAMQGINNRNYVDPNMFRSIMVEKGPSMTRGLKSGVGGAVQIRTIEASDIVREGKSWGAEIKVGTSSNSIAPSFDAHSIVGMDYRDIPDARAVFNLFGSAPGVRFEESPTQRRSRDDTSLFNLDDRRVFLSAAYRQESFDVLAAYSHSQRGNYFAGSHGGEDYTDNLRESAVSIPSIKNLYPNITRFYAPGWEAAYTATELESVLLKSNVYLPGGQRLSLNFSRNDLAFYELPAVLTSEHVQMTDRDPEWDVSRDDDFEYPFPETLSKNDTYRINYVWQPADNRWLDVDVALWRTVSKNRRYQNGDTTYQVSESDRAWDAWVECNHAEDAVLRPNCAGLIGAPAPTGGEENFGQYSVFIGNEIQAESIRTGVDFSNRMNLTPQLALTLAGDWQFEREEDFVPVKTSIMPVGFAPSQNGPRSGRREEYGASANLEWNPTARLHLGAGARYGGYKSFDTELYRYRRDRNVGWRGNDIITHQLISHQRLMTDAELAMVNAFANAGDAERQQRQQELEAYQAANNLSGYQINQDTGLYYWSARETVPMVEGKADRNQNPFYNGTLDIHETADNPQGMTGTYPVYLPFGVFGQHLTVRADDPYRLPEEESGSAWSSSLVVSWRMTDAVRFYGRFSSTARFPSLLESTNTISLFANGERTYDLKPERNDAWEFGYVHNLSSLLPGWNMADIKLTYYHNTIHDFYDRTYDLATIQFDRKIMSGIEFQSRFDTRRYYSNFSMTWRLRQETCDADYATELDPHYGRIPECMSGGHLYTLSFLSLQPLYSINWDVGTRLIQERLNLGMRLRYHSKSKNGKLDTLLRQYQTEESIGSGAGQFAYGIYNERVRPYYWSAVYIFDLYAEYHFTSRLMARFSVDNLMDRYYLDPLTRVPAPGPGRTLMLDLSIAF